MSARVYRLSQLLSSPGLVASIVEELAAGAVCVYPTETIYGIGGRADSETVRSRILEAKGRPSGNPMILIAASVGAFEPFDLHVPAAAQKLAAAFWPGNLTLVLEPRSGRGALGIRVSDHPFIQTVGPLLPAPLFSTSANISGQPYDGDPVVLREVFADCVDFIVDAGALPPSMPSTVVKVAADSAVTIVREGAVATERIRTVLGREAPG